jgi:malonate transporter
VALDPLWARIAIIDAALPTAATVFVLARRYGVEVETSSNVVLLSTLGSIVSVSALLALLAPG